MVQASLPVVDLAGILAHTLSAPGAPASDIHVEATDGGRRVRFQVDGLLHEADSPATLEACPDDRLHTITYADGTVITYVYDSAGNRQTVTTSCSGSGC